MGPRWIAFVAAIFGLMAVGIGAMGSHSLPDRLKKSGLDEAQVAKKLEQCEIGVKYQMYHALAMLAVGLSALPSRSALARAACGMFLAGSIFFAVVCIACLSSIRWGTGRSFRWGVSCL